MKRAMAKGGGRLFLRRVFRQWRKEELRLHLTGEERELITVDGNEVYGCIEVWGDATNGTNLDQKGQKTPQGEEEGGVQGAI